MTFVQADLTLLRNVDRVCRELQAKEKRINLLFMTPGFLTLDGRSGKRAPKPFAAMRARTPESINVYPDLGTQKPRRGSIRSCA